MKKTFQKFAVLLSALVLLAMVFSLNSCKKSEDTTTPSVIVLDGYYVKGAGTAYADFNDNGMMKATYNEVLNPVTLTSTKRASLMELYIPVKAGADGFNIVKVAGSVTKIYGPGTDFLQVTSPTTDEPHGVFFKRGSLVESTDKFTVDTSGMYHVVLDYDLNKVSVTRVKWGLIGAATPGGWSTGTSMPEPTFNLTDMKWEITDLTLTKGSWKFRYSNGWKIIFDTAYDNGGGKLGVKVNTNFGYNVDTLLPGGADMTNSVQGVYTCKLEYVLGTGYKATLTKTANLPPVDYSAYQMGIIGNCYLKADLTQAAWDENFGTSLPSVTGGTTYTWTYTVDLNLAAGEFKFRQGTDWAGKSIGYTDVTMAGPGASHFTDSGSGNFKVDVVGNYTLVLVIDAVTENYTVTATKN
ncbi:MAG: SusF/SusE family outer membrane protein [Bacteroidetes bacterium]|nr:SusF/SusE family outer membrane protein [Bacteroidota bacterium]